MLKELEELQKQATAELLISKTEEEFLALRTKYLGRKGLLTGFLRNLGNIEPEKRPLVGNRCNEIKHALTEKIERALSTISRQQQDDYLLR